MNCKTFSQRTSMHGFSELYSAKNWFWTIFWTTTVVCSIVITVYMVQSSVNKFFAETTVTNLQQAKSEDLMYPGVKICYPHWSYWLDLNKTYQLGFTENDVLIGISFLNNPVYSFHRFDVANALNEFRLKLVRNETKNLRSFYTTISTANLITVDNDFETPINYSTIFEQDIEEEITVKLCLIIDEAEIVKMMTSVVTKYDKNKKEKIQQLQGNSVSFVISYYDYGDQTATVATTISGDNFIVENVRLKNECKEKENGMMNMFLFPNIFDKYHYQELLSDDKEKIRISVSISVHNWKNVQRAPCREGVRFASTNITCSDECSRRYMGDEQSEIFLEKDFATSDNDFQLLKSRIIFLKITTTDNTVKNYHHAYAPLISDDIVRNTDVGNTSETDTDYSGDYADNGRIEQIEFDYCNSMEIDNENGVKDTAFGDKNSETNVDGAAYDACIYDCRTSTGCMVYTYEFSYQSNGPTNRRPVISTNNKTSTNFMKKKRIKIVYPVENRVLIITQEFAQTWDGFVGNVGGLLGIWTGASVLSFVQMIYYLCFFTDHGKGQCCWRNCLTSKTDKQRRTSAHKEYYLRDEIRKVDPRLQYQTSFIALPRLAVLSSTPKYDHNG